MYTEWILQLRWIGIFFPGQLQGRLTRNMCQRVTGFDLPPSCKLVKHKNDSKDLSSEMKKS